MAGHIPKVKISPVRHDVYLSLLNRSDATVFGTGAHADVKNTRVSYNEYVQLGMRHKFCVVASGDNFATPKFTEAILFAAHGGCLPFVVSAGYPGKWPFEKRFSLRNHGIFTTTRDLRAALRVAENMNATRATQMRSYFQSVASAYRSIPPNLNTTTASTTLIDEMCELN